MNDALLPQVSMDPRCEVCGSHHTFVRHSRRMTIEADGKPVRAQKQYRRCRACGANFTTMRLRGELAEPNVRSHEMVHDDASQQGGCGHFEPPAVASSPDGAPIIRRLPRCRFCGSTALRVNSVIKRRSYCGVHPITGPYTAIEWRRVYCACCGRNDQMLDRPYRPRDWKGPPPNWTPPGEVDPA